MNWTDIGVSAFKDFPNAKLLQKHGGDGNGAGAIRMARINELDESVNPLKLLKGKHIEIATIQMYEPYVHVHILKDGTANYNIMKPDTTTSATYHQSAPEVLGGLEKIRYQKRAHYHG